MSEKQVIPAPPMPHGIYIDKEGVHVCAAFPNGKECGVMLHNVKTGKEELFLLPESCRNGHVYSALIPCNEEDYDTYCLYRDGHTFMDPYARSILGLETWGVNTKEKDLRGLLNIQAPDFTEDVNPKKPLKDSFLYLLHVRGFTMHVASGVSKNKRGTFAGIEEKIPYLKDLGVTAVELLPAYEMNIVSLDHNPEEGLYVEDGRVLKDVHGKTKVNYWGFKEGYYFAPRKAYACDKDHPEEEFASLVKALHKNGMELVMQFYFPNWISPVLMLESVRYWVYTYHIDGVHLKGERIPTNMLATDPLLQDIKIFHDDFDAKTLFGEKKYCVDAQVAEYRNDFRIIASRFLKGDDTTLPDFVSRMNHTGQDLKRVNYVGNYDGFTLMDLVSYEHKHNEENGENNTDGENNNFSWNCGVEGKSRKKAVTELRKRQIKNILTMLFFSQGTPMLHAGDEFGNSQDGNNNPYCQDNAIGWTDWSQLSKNEDLYAYVKFLIKLRMSHKILHTGEPFTLIDKKSIGYPDLSYHGIEAWRPDLTNYSHAVGLLYCGVYAEETAPFVYVAYNMHWADIKLALPTLPDGLSWKLIADSSASLVDMNGIKCAQTSVKSPSHSVQILISSGSWKPETNGKRQPF